jgi:hypothetical protein
MPFYGEVWRQTSPPILWVADFHDQDRLAVRDLRANSTAPILVDPIIRRNRESVDPLGGGEQSQFIYEEPVYDSEDEEKDETDGGGDKASEKSQDESEDGGFEVEENGGFGGGGWEDESNWEEIDAQMEEDEEFAEEFAERERKGDEVKESWDVLGRQMEMMLGVIEEIKRYPSSHRHLQEIPHGSAANFLQCLEWADRRKKLQNRNTMPTTFGRQRRGLVFMGSQG